MIARATLAVLAVAAFVLTALISRPFGAALFMAAVLAGALYPIQVRFTALLRGRRRLSAALLTAGIVLAVLLPLSWVAASLVKEVLEAVGWVRSALRSGGTDAVLSHLPHALRWPLRQFVHGLLNAGTLLEQLSARMLPAVGTVGGVLSQTARAALEVVLCLVAFFFLLTDGTRLVSWFELAIPLEPGRFRELLETFRRVTRAVLVSTLATDGIQSLMALAGFVLAGVPQPLFFTVVTFVAGLIPVLGASVVVVIIGAVEIAAGHLVAGIFLAAWGVLVVGLVDNIIKPHLIRGGVEIHAAVVFFSLLGGAAVFGPVGLVAGPLIVAFLIAVVRIYSSDLASGGDQARGG